MKLFLGVPSVSCGTSPVGPLRQKLQECGPKGGCSSPNEQTKRTIPVDKHTIPDPIQR